MLEELLSEGIPPATALNQVHGELGGDANLGYLAATGELLIFSEYPGNRMWCFAIGDAEMGATELHSSDDSIFRMLFPHATARRVPSGVCSLS